VALPQVTTTSFNQPFPQLAANVPSQATATTPMRDWNIFMTSAVYVGAGQMPIDNAVPLGGCGE